MQLGKAAHSFCEVTERVETGKAWKEILGVAEETHADLIVMGAHTGGALGRLFLGSTANQIVRHASCPVLVVREKRGATDQRPRVEAAATQEEHSVTAAH
jgi:nucleotide-binding universal stress UspA family protein